MQTLNSQIKKQSFYKIPCSHGFGCKKFQWEIFQKNHPIQSLQQSKDVLVIWGKINCKRSFKKLQLCERGSSLQQKKNNKTPTSSYLNPLISTKSPPAKQRNLTWDIWRSCRCVETLCFTPQFLRTTCKWNINAWTRLLKCQSWVRCIHWCLSPFPHVCQHLSILPSSISYIHP